MDSERALVVMVGKALAHRRLDGVGSPGEQDAVDFVIAEARRITETDLGAADVVKWIVLRSMTVLGLDTLGSDVEHSKEMHELFHALYERAMSGDVRGTVLAGLDMLHCASDFVEKAG